MVSSPQSETNPNAADFPHPPNGESIIPKIDYFISLLFSTKEELVFVIKIKNFKSWPQTNAMF